MNQFRPALLVVLGLVVIIAAAGLVIGFEIPLSTVQFQDSMVDSQPDHSNSTIQLAGTALTKKPGHDANGSFIVLAYLHNTGPSNASPLVTLRIDATDDGVFETTIEQRRTTIPSGEVVVVEFSVPGDRFGPGEYRYGVGNAEGTKYWATNTIFLRPTTLSVQSVSAGSVVRGDNVTVSAQVANIGDFTGTEPVSVAIDRDRDDRFNASERSATHNLSVAAYTNETVTFEVDSTQWNPGRYNVRVSTESDSGNGSLEVLQPATFEITAVRTEGTVVRGEPLNVTVNVTNVGDVAGNGTVSFVVSDPIASVNRTLVLDANETTSITLSVGTSNLSGGNHTHLIETGTHAANVSFRVLAGHFDVTNLQGVKTLYLGQEISFSAQIENTGDATDTQLIELRIDVDDDGSPESYGLTTNTTLNPGQQTTVVFTIPVGATEDSIPRREMLGSHIFGVYTEDSNLTSVFAVKPRFSDDSETSNRASKDEISQSKYGVYYHQLSAETQTQVNEIYQRQPFTGDLVITEVLTREEIARERFGVDIEPGESFNFSALDIELQQRIEGEFDAQFQNDDGDRVESWDELANARYGTDYDSLTEEQQETIRQLYRDQFPIME